MVNHIPLLEVCGLQLAFDGHSVLAGVDLTVPRGAVISVLGKSGTGKSVFLKCLAGLLPPDAGEIRFDGQLLRAGDGAGRAKFRRRCSYLFQQNALLDSLTALENVALPLEQTTRLSRGDILTRAGEALRCLELEKYLDVHPGRLSGGMQKRLALARALVTRPELVLFDEPTAGLDPLRRNVVFEMLARYQRTFGFTALVVTHDVPEALVASDTVALLDQGRICFCGSPAQFNASPEPIVRAFRDSAEALRENIHSNAPNGSALLEDFA